MVGRSGDSKQKIFMDGLRDVQSTNESMCYRQNKLNGKF